MHMARIWHACGVHMACVGGLCELPPPTWTVDMTISSEGVILVATWPEIVESTATSPLSKKKRSREGSPRLKTISPLRYETGLST